MPTLPEYNGKYKVGFVDFETHSEPDKLGVLGRVFYPSSSAKIGTSNWLPSNWNYAHGYGSFLKIHPFFSATLIYPTLSFAKMPCQEEIPLATDQAKFPVVFFSHGLGGIRTTYSQLCCNLASRGFIVVSLEHGDGTASSTSRMNGEIHIPYRRATKEELDMGEPFGFNFRAAQLNQRRDEIAMSHELMNELNEGKPVSFLDAPEIYAEFAGKFDFGNAVMIGHSFGAATSINVLTSPTKSLFKCSIILDPWMFALKPDLKVEVPLLNIQSNRFHWKANLDSIRGLSVTENSMFGYIKDTRHQDASDMGLFFPWLMGKAKQSGPAEPHIIHHVQDKLIFDFIQLHLKLDTPVETAFDLSEHVIYGDQAFVELYEAMSPVVPK